MKTIEPVSIWDNGKNVSALYLGAYAVNVTLGISADFYYSLMDENHMRVASGNLSMTGEAYEQWTIDAYAWDWIAQQLNLTITGDYISPVMDAPESGIESPAV